MQTNLPAFVDFTSRWLAKASRYRRDSLSGAYDRFFTTYVVYSRAYDEATRLVYAVRPEIFMSKVRRESNQAPPPISRVGDRLKATRGVMAFCGQSLRSEVFSMPSVLEAIEQLEQLAAKKRFYFFFDREKDRPMPQKDLQMLHGIYQGRVAGILEILHQLRCNMFHGQKNFEDEQLSVLRPANVILTNVTKHVVQKIVINGQPMQQLKQ